MEDTAIQERLKELNICIEEVNKKFNGLMMSEETKHLRARIEALKSNQETAKKVLGKLKQWFFRVVSCIEELKKEGDDVNERLNELMMTQGEDTVNQDLGFSGFAFAPPSSSAVTDDIELGISTNIEGLREEMRALMASETASEGASEHLLGWLRDLGPLLDSDEDQERD